MWSSHHEKRNMKRGLTFKAQLRLIEQENLENFPKYRKKGKPVSIADIKKFKKGDSLKFKVFNFHFNKWKTFTFKFDKIGKHKNTIFVHGYSKYIYDNNPLHFDKLGNLRTSESLNISPVYFSQEKKELRKNLSPLTQNPNIKPNDLGPQRRRNPFKNKEEIPLSEAEIKSFFEHIKNAILFGKVEELSHTIILSKIGFKCDTCDENYMRCACEGSRTTQGMPCEYCDLKFCMCSYNFSEKTPRNEIRKHAWEFAKTILNRKEKKYLIDLIYTWPGWNKNAKKFDLRTKKYVYDPLYDYLRNKYSISESYIKKLLSI